MIMLTKEQERILKHIISLPKNGRNTVSIGNQMTTYPENIDEQKRYVEQHLADYVVVVPLPKTNINKIMANFVQIKK